MTEISMTQRHIFDNMLHWYVIGWNKHDMLQETIFNKPTYIQAIIPPKIAQGHKNLNGKNRRYLFWNVPIVMWEHEITKGSSEYMHSVISLHTTVMKTRSKSFRVVALKCVPNNDPIPRVT